MDGWIGVGVNEWVGDLYVPTRWTYHVQIDHDLQ